MLLKNTLTPKDYYTTHFIGDSEYLFDGDELLFEVKSEVHPYFYRHILENKIHFLGIFEMNAVKYIMYIYLQTDKPEIYIAEILSIEPFEIMR